MKQICMPVSNAKLLSILIMLGLAMNLAGKTILIWHWKNLNFNLRNYHPLTPIIGFSGAILYIAIMLLTPEKEHWYLWVSAAAWLVCDSVLLAAVAHTYIL